MKQYVRYLARELGFRRSADFRAIEAECEDFLDLLVRGLGLAGKSRAQLKQDIFVLLQTGFKRGGFFVEFGAANGVDLSNTYLLEKEFGWQGILAEPATCWHDALRRDRNVTIDTRCVWTESGKILDFTMANEAELSTISKFSGADGHSAQRQGGQTYSVETISLVDLLKAHNAPRVIDYLSIDTEGSEFEILSSVDFSQYDIRIITCEHNFTADRERIFDLLVAKGYERKFSSISQWDDWFVRSAGAGLT